MKQFNLTQLVFDDLNHDTHLIDGWHPVEEQRDIDKICETITGGGKVWLGKR
ncbi:hypothetical protein [Haemophilus parainfluenzae]|uniref:Uncharacterized protein n=1 Tax=Haemophilus parainfluenzae TaxID=729 RepID=A0A377JKN5_HAEPA|nr:hypothetical protein [Haemophilus parainfluenzae]STP06323.1 Uncharacterised protein [Haemophilus parainfluenzae]